MDDEVFAILLPNGRLWGFRYSHESAAEECAALNERDGPGHRCKRFIPAEVIESLTAEIEQRNTWLSAALSAITDGDRYAALPSALRDWRVAESTDYNPDPPCDRCGGVCCGCYAEEAAAHDAAICTCGHPDADRGRSIPSQKPDLSKGNAIHDRSGSVSDRD